MRPPSRLAPERARRGSDDGILPLINVVFLLLIFFMLAGRLSATDPLPVEPPQSASPDPWRDAPVVIYLSADGRLAVDETPVDRERLAEVVRERRAAEGAASPVQLKADAVAEARSVIDLMSTLRGAGVESLRLVTIAADG